MQRKLCLAVAPCFSHIIPFWDKPILGLYMYSYLLLMMKMKTIHTKEYKSFLEWLARKRQLAGLSQQQLADSLGKPQSYVSKYETGERRLDFLEVLDICIIIEADPSQFIEAYMRKGNSIGH